MKRAQQSVGMSFGMIFSIFLIVVFIIIAFIGIKNFLDIGNTAEVGFFYEDLQDNIDQAWRGQSGQFSIDINVPAKITTVCFADLSKSLRGIYADEYDQIKDYEFYNSNVFLLPSGETEGQPHKEILHINITRITAQHNPYCVNADGELTIKKDFYDKLVSVE